MSRSTLISGLRKQHWFAPLVAEIEAFGAEYTFESPTGRGHPKLVISYRGQSRKMAVPSSASGALRVANMVSMARAKLEEMR